MADRLAPAGRARERPERVVAGKTCSHPSTRAALRSRGIAIVCPERADRIARRTAVRRPTTRWSRPGRGHRRPGERESVRRLDDDARAAWSTAGELG